MSGIAGIIHFDGKPVEPGLIEKMTSAMAYRGPDGIHHWVKGSVALGQCMLRTTPESLEEHQPLTNEDESLVLVMDGRVDNWEELRAELLSRGARLRTCADAELVLRAYEAWGSDCVQRIDGNFSLVIWDAPNQQAFCARDHIGYRPFYFQWESETFTFASELQPLLKRPGVSEEINEGIVAEYLANEWHSRAETFWNGVNKLMAAHRLMIGRQRVRTEQYWAPNPYLDLPCSSEGDYAEYYRTLFFDVVRRMSRSQAALACEASGGLDSSAILSVAENLRRRGRLLAPSIDAFALDFAGAGEADELAYGRDLGHFLGLPIHEIAPTQKPLTWYWEQARRFRNFPGYPNGVMAIGIREAARDRGCRALLVGVGGDEWIGMPFYGEYYSDLLAQRQWRQLYTCLVHDRQEVGTSETLRWFGRRGLMPLLPEKLKRSYRTWRKQSENRIEWLSEVMLQQLDMQRRAGRLSEAVRLRRPSQNAQLRILEGAYDASAREAEEHIAALAGLELRAPFHNRRMIEFAFASPAHLRLRGRTTKWLHRHALRDLLPLSIRERRSKADFMVVFRNQLDAIGGELNEIELRRARWLSPEKVGDLYNSYRAGRLAGHVEWVLWSLIGCDAVAGGEPIVTAESDGVPPELTGSCFDGRSSSFKVSFSVR